jgi:predicted phage tail protein
VSKPHGSRYLGVASLAAGIFCAVLGLALIILAFFKDALSSYAYGIYGLVIVSIGIGLIAIAKSTLKPQG